MTLIEDLETLASEVDCGWVACSNGTKDPCKKAERAARLRDHAKRLRDEMTGTALVVIDDGNQFSWLSPEERLVRAALERINGGALATQEKQP